MVHYPLKHAKGGDSISKNGRWGTWSATECSDECARKESCKAVDYVGADKSCHMHTSVPHRITVTASTTGQTKFKTVSQYAKSTKFYGKKCPGKR
jgi:hypothetical protein